MLTITIFLLIILLILLILLSLIVNSLNSLNSFPQIFGGALTLEEINILQSEFNLVGYEFDKIFNTADNIETAREELKKLQLSELYKNFTEISTNDLSNFFKKSMPSCINSENNIFYIGNIVQPTDNEIYALIKRQITDNFYNLYKKPISEINTGLINFRTEQFNYDNGRDKYLNNLPLIIISIIDDNCNCILLEPTLFDQYRNALYSKIEAITEYEKNKASISTSGMSLKEIATHRITSVFKTAQEYKKMEKMHKNIYDIIINLIDSSDLISIHCNNLQQWKPMLIKNFSYLKNMYSLVDPSIKLIETLPTFIIVGHGKECNLLPIQLNDNEYVVMNCNPHTSSFVSNLNFLSTYYTKFGETNKTEKIENNYMANYINYHKNINDYDDPKNNAANSKHNICVFLKKCPNLTIKLKNNCTKKTPHYINLQTLNIDCNVFFKTCAYEFPIEYVINPNSTIFNIDSNSNIFESESYKNQLNTLFQKKMSSKEQTYIKKFKNKIIDIDKISKKSFYYNASETNFQTSLSEIIRKIREYQQDKGQSGFCIVVNTCRI